MTMNVTAPLMSCLVPLSLAADCIRENVKYQESLDQKWCGRPTSQPTDCQQTDTAVQPEQIKTARHFSNTGLPAYLSISQQQLHLVPPLCV